MATSKLRQFLAVLRRTGNVRQSCGVAQLSTKTVYNARKREPWFEKAWNDALTQYKGRCRLAMMHPMPSTKRKLTPEAETEFLSYLFTTGGNVSMAARLIGVSRTQLYERRDTNAQFRFQWELHRTLGRTAERERGFPFTQQYVHFKRRLRTTLDEVDDAARHVKMDAKFAGVLAERDRATIEAIEEGPALSLA